ncbi:hypothetical protein M422DRAFT_271844 [Sphaerobolus stellatus SS14]|uniref:BAH domain-containing protein n=1 Tax=Sphaerobolus stellatus (strain SS14) TaxID=990650 RepID=A0A0C9TCW6_SPHS4|nr:hypothetical protein M422DRAFT_271844 [Sphaerobolus stellatus SS14]
MFIDSDLDQIHEKKALKLELGSDVLITCENTGKTEIKTSDYYGHIIEIWTDMQMTEETLAVLHVKWYYTSNSLLEWIRKRKSSFNLPTEEIEKIQRRFLDRLGRDELVLTSDSDYIDIQTVLALCEVY